MRDLCVSVEGGLRGVQNFAILAEMKPKSFLHLPVWPEKHDEHIIFERQMARGNERLHTRAVCTVWEMERAEVN